MNPFSPLRSRRGSRSSSRWFAAFATAVLAATAGTATAAVITIDDFDTPAFPGGQELTRGTLGTSQSLYNAGGPGLLGGSRLVELSVTLDGGSEAHASVNSSVLGRLVYENGADVESILTLRYDGNGAGLGQNWNALDEITFLVDFADQAGTLTVELFADANFAGTSFATKTTVIPELTLPNSPFFVSFGSFTTSGGFDFSDVDSIRISIEGTSAYDMVVHQIQASDVFTNAVPEPAAAIPVGAFLAGTVWFVIRRRRAAGAVTTAVA